MKKLSLTLGALIAAAAPVVSVVSCGRPDYDHSIYVIENIKIAKSDIKFYGPEGYGKISTKIHEADNYLPDDLFAISANQKKLHNGDNVKVKIKIKPARENAYDDRSEYRINGKEEVTLDCVVSGLTEKEKSLSDSDLKNPRIADDVIRSLIDYSCQRQTSVFYNFAHVTNIDSDIFDSDDWSIEYLPENIDFSSVEFIEGLNSLKSLPENIDFSSVKAIDSNGFLNLKSLPENIDFSSVEVIAGLQNLESLPENIDFSSVKAIDSDAFLNLKSLPENIDFSSVKEIDSNAFLNLKSLPENIDFSSVEVIAGLQNLESLPEKIRFNHKINYKYFLDHLPKLGSKYNEQWFNAHRNPAKTTT